MNCKNLSTHFGGVSKKDEKASFHWFNVSKLCIKKVFGGMGFQDLNGFNLAMLGKLGWKLIT